MCREVMLRAADVLSKQSLMDHSLACGVMNNLMMSGQHKTNTFKMLFKMHRAQTESTENL